MKFEKFKNIKTNRWIQFGTKKFYESVENGDISFLDCSIEFFIEFFIENKNKDCILNSIDDIIDIFISLNIQNITNEQLQIILNCFTNICATRRNIKEKFCNTLFFQKLMEIVQIHGVTNEIQYFITNIQCKNSYGIIYRHPVFLMNE